MSLNQLRVFFCAVLMVMATATMSAAVPINHGTFVGTTVTYTDVTEEAITPGDSPILFGAPTVIGNQLDFNPIGFGAASSAGGVDITDGNLQFGIWTDIDSIIDTIVLTEAGDYTLAGVGTSATSASVGMSGTFEITEVDAGAVILGAAISIPFSAVFSPSGGTFDLVNDGGIAVA